jgi:hypothetical protein
MNILRLLDDWHDDEEPVIRQSSDQKTECTEIGKLSDVDREGKIASVEIRTQESVSIFQFDVGKFVMNFMPMKGMTISFQSSCKLYRDP